MKYVSSCVDLSWGNVLTWRQIYMFRLMIEYARVMDDNRDRIGYSGDGSELDKYDSKLPLQPANFGHS